MDFENLKERISLWAEAQHRVSAAYVFGSRARGAARENSDIDVAVELLTPKGNAGSFCDWVELGDELRNSLQCVLPITLDLTQYEDKDRTPTVHRGLCAGCELVYTNGTHLFEKEKFS